MKYIPLEDLDVFKQAMSIGEIVWQAVDAWSYFQKDTVGRQFCRSADSVAANIAEGYGRYYFAESRQFYYYARGSILETKTWLQKARTRGLVQDEPFEQLLQMLEQCHKSLNAFIKTQKP